MQAGGQAVAVLRLHCAARKGVTTRWEQLSPFEAPQSVAQCLALGDAVAAVNTLTKYIMLQPRRTCMKFVCLAVAGRRS